uniref:Tail assembly chaperone n=1 Tax=viral metagenome TaxID=1070528 RepID=A0A6M3JWB7_9ZZZZ
MPEQTIVKTEYSTPGYIIQTDISGNKTKYPIAPVIRTEDVPTGLTYTQVASISALANLMVIVIRTLIEHEILTEEFADSLGLDMDLDHIIAAVEAMGGSYHDPDLDDSEN